MQSRRSGRDTSGDEMENLEEQMKKLNTGEKRDINILLLGETGVGKSTFINAFCNYLQYAKLDYAMKGKLTTLIPAKFTITDENYEEQIVQVGEDTNEFVEVGASATQASRSYVFPIRRGKVRVRFIDTPGVGDTRGIEQDNVNFENILSFIGEVKHLNAICILLKPNNPRLTVMFEFCIKQLLSRLEKSASRNLIFVFTNSRSTFYRPGETMPALKKLLEQVQSVDIPLTKNNIFCTDNEAFRFLAAVNNGIQFTPMDVENFAQSWKKSVHECWRMISYIAGDASTIALEPHLVKNTISVNEARRLIVQLSQPLAEIAQLIHDNITALQRHKMALQVSNNTLAELREKLYLPVINLRVTKLDQPTTVCTSSKCSTIYRVGERNKWHYHQKCHSPCYLRNVPKEIVGSPELASCAAMSGTTCQRCQCNYQLHMHIYYETETYEDKLENEAVKSEISNKQVALIRAKNFVTKIERRLQEYEEERDTIIKTTAKFAYFLKANAITPYNDAYQSYLRYLIDREKSMGDNMDYEMIKQFEKMLREYTEEKNALTRAMAQPTRGMTSISADDIIDCVQDLYSLKHNGLKIQELFAKQKAARKDENKSETREYVHEHPQKKLRKRKKKNKNKIQNVADTTDSEYATDHGQRNYPNQQPARQNFKPNPNQRWRQPYNQQPNQGYAGHNQRTMPADGSQQSPLQYLKIRQNPSGQFDLSFGQRCTPQPGNRANPQPHAANPPYQNFGQHGAIPRQNQNPNRSYGNQRFGKPNPRSHSPYRAHGVNNPSGPFNPGLKVFNPGPHHFNSGPQQFNSEPQQFNSGNSGPRRFNSGPQQFNSEPQQFNSEPQQFNSGPQQFNSGNSGPRRFNSGPQRFNSGPEGFNQGPKYFNNNVNNPPPYTKQDKQNSAGFQQRGGKNASDSGCESTGKEKPKYGSYPQGNNFVRSNRQHCLDFSSDSSSSESTDEEAYMSCRKF